ncbi:MAG TPA: tetratricopeptide repeat protein, partial [Elusimicrobiota bacterium]|nr:tetratricopeptide repeat protein [Elusimicrobiota bacterium]
EVPYAWALLAAGAPGARLPDGLEPNSDRMLVNARIRVLRAIALLGLGRRPQAAAEIQGALAAGQAQGSESSLRPVVLEILSSWPAPRRAALIEFFETAPGLGRAMGEDAWPGAWLELARAEAAAGRRNAASRRLADADRAGLSDEQRFRAAEDDPGDGAFAAQVLRGLRRKGPGEAGRLINLAEAASRAGRGAKALALAALAEKSFPLDPEQSRRAAFVDWDGGDRATAVSLLKRLRYGSPADADLFLDMAERAGSSPPRPPVLGLLELVGDMPLDAKSAERLAKAYDALAETGRAAMVRGRRRGDFRGRLESARAAAAAGDRAGALERLKDAGRLDLDDADSRSLMLADQDLGEYARALEVADRRVRARPADAEWRSDRGLLRAMRGDRDGAIADWKTALRLDPDLSAPYLSLGSLYASLGRRAEALELYRTALSRPAVLRDAGAARLILAERAKLSPEGGAGAGGP